MEDKKTPDPVSLEHYQACMVLSGVGDALGYKKGEWEFCFSGEQIHEELKQLGGLGNIKVTEHDWPFSDDTVMHIATAKALVKNEKSDEKLFASLASEYKECMKEMSGRSPGLTCMNSCHRLKPKVPGGCRIPFDPRGGGCGAATRAMCIGLRYPRKNDIDDLIKVSVESGRMTHNHPTGYLGSFAAALFTAYSIQRKPIREWGKEMMDLLPQVQDYVKLVDIDVKENLQAWDYFKTRWENYLKVRGITEGDLDPIFLRVYGIEERDEFYKSVSFAGWGGASGHDAPMIAYDALLGYDGTWEDLCSRAMFHGGHSDSTGVIAAAWYGAMCGFKGVPENHYKKLEKRTELVELAEKIYCNAYIPMIPQQNYESPTYIIRKKALVNIFTLDKVSSKYERNNDVDYTILEEFFMVRCHLQPTIVKHGNATCDEITECIERIDGSKHDAFFFIFISFLDENKSTKSDTTDSLSVKSDKGQSKEPVQLSILPAELIGMVDKKQSLALKPKIFIFQADDNLLPTKVITKVRPTEEVEVFDADQLVIISTLPQKFANLLLISAIINILEANNDTDVFTCVTLIMREVMRIIETLHIDMNDVPGGELPVPRVFSTLTKRLNFYNEIDYPFGL